MSSRTPAPSLRALLAGLVDYAGLFPPAALPMADAVSAYRDHLASPESWMLGRFVVPIDRLDELRAEHARAVLPAGAAWRLAALASDDTARDARTLRAFNAANPSLVVDVVEAKAATPEGVTRAARDIGGAAELFVELPIADDPRALLRAVRDAGVHAKVRTGGLTAAAFPTAAQLARFIVRAVELRVPFKATAGLHHPLRAEHRLTYADDAPRGTMFGFLNVFAAAAFARGGMNETTVAQLLEERDPERLVANETGLHWRGHTLSASDVSDARSHVATSFGSCSFQEPVDDLHQLGLL